MSKKAVVVWIIIVIVVGIGAFFGGSAYGKNQSASARTAFAGRTGSAFAGRGAAGTAGAGGTATAGTILSATPTSLTIQLRTGSTQIVFISTSTPIMQEVAGSASDLAPGDQITIIGSANSDGSLTASSIQLRPASSSPMMMASSTTQ